MSYEKIQLKILLPYKVFDIKENVLRIVVETSEGSYGILPNRRDCVMILEPGILVYETKNKVEEYIALDTGILVKTGGEVIISVRNANGGVDLENLHENVENEFFQISEEEEKDRTFLKELESSFVNKLVRYQSGKQ